MHILFVSTTYHSSQLTTVQLLYKTVVLYKSVNIPDHSTKCRCNIFAAASLIIMFLTMMMTTIKIQYAAITNKQHVVHSVSNCNYHAYLVTYISTEQTRHNTPPFWAAATALSSSPNWRIRGPSWPDASAELKLCRACKMTIISQHWAPSCLLANTEVKHPILDITDMWSVPTSNMQGH